MDVQVESIEHTAETNYWAVGTGIVAALRATDQIRPGLSAEDRGRLDGATGRILSVFTVSKRIQFGIGPGGES